MPVVPPDPADFPSATRGRSTVSTSTDQESINGSIRQPQETPAVDYLSRKLEFPEVMPHKASREEIDMPKKDWT